MKLLQTEYENADALVEISVPQFFGFSDEAFEASFNAELQQEADGWLEQFEQSAGKPEYEKKKIRIAPQMTYNQNELLSFYTENYLFLEGVHGNWHRRARTVDLVENRVLHLADLFLDGEYRTFLNQRIENIVRTNPDGYHDLWEKPVVGEMHEDFFYLGGDGLVLFFPPYELSYYARGFVEFTIPYEILSGYLKPEYRKLVS